MFNKCSGYAPQFRKMETPSPTSMPDIITQNTPINPIMPVPTVPASQLPYTPSAPSNQMPYSPSAPYNQTPYAPSSPQSPSTAPATPSAPANDNASSPGINQPTPINPTVPLTPSNPLVPEVIPNAPLFTVPPNPLLPPDYQEILSYESLQYMNGFLRTQIGRGCEVEFLIGSNSTETRSGVLVGVGLNYILLQDQNSKEIMMCDFYAIKFVDFRY